MIALASFAIVALYFVATDVIKAWVKIRVRQCESDEEIARLDANDHPTHH